MKEYVTQGTVQVELIGKTIDVRINPVQEFGVRYRGMDYIVFMPDDPKSLDAKAINIKKTEPFTSTNARFIQALTDAALKGLTVEIKVVFSKAPEIVSVKIPATLRSETV